MAVGSGPGMPRFRTAQQGAQSSLHTSRCAHANCAYTDPRIPCWTSWSCLVENPQPSLHGPCTRLPYPATHCTLSPAHRYNPIKTIKTNFLGTMNMLGLAKRTRARFLISSTSEVYGDPVEHPQTEGYWGNVNPIGERSCYDEGKRAAECLTMDYHREHGLEVRWGDVLLIMVM